MTTSRLILREDKKWEQVVFAEVLVPDVVNSFGDIYTRAAIVEFAYEFARQGYGLDVDHDNVLVWNIVFVSTVTDENSSRFNDLTVTTPTMIQINSSIDIDNIIIRTGDGV